MIVERPVRSNIALEVLNLGESSFVLDQSWLGGPGFGNPLGAPGDEPVWSELTDYLTAVKIDRGGTRDGITVKNAPGMLTFTLKGIRADGDPGEDAPIIEGQPVRVIVVTPEGEREIFTGEVRELAVEYRRIKRRLIPFLTVTALDGIAELEEITRYGAMPPGGVETFSERIQRLAKSAGVIPIETPDDYDYPGLLEPVTRLGSTVYESSLLNHLTLAANSAGAMFWMDTDGVVRFQPRQYDSANEIVFEGYQPAIGGGTPGALHPIAIASDSGTSSQVNAALLSVKATEPDPDDPTNILDKTVELEGADWERPNRIVAVLEVNSYMGGGAGLSLVPRYTFGWLLPYQSGWDAMPSSMTWNAQEDIAALLTLDIGSSVKAPSGGIGLWPWHIVIGISHTITAKRWITTLTLIGAWP